MARHVRLQQFARRDLVIVDLDSARTKPVDSKRAEHVLDVVKIEHPSTYHERHNSVPGPDPAGQAAAVTKDNTTPQSTTPQKYRMAV